MGIKSIILTTTLFFSFLAYSQTQSDFIIIDQFGYLPGAKKIAVIKDPQWEKLLFTLFPGVIQPLIRVF